MPAIQKITPCLWFDREAGEAAQHYISVFGDGRVVSMSHYGDGMPLPKGTPLVCEFELCGQRFQALNGGPMYKFSEAISLSVSCETQAEIDHFWNGLGEGGTPGRCGWLKDKFGVSWQVVPAILAQLMRGDDAGRTARVVKAFMQMSKFDIAALENAATGA